MLVTTGSSGSHAKYHGNIELRLNVSNSTGLILFSLWLSDDRVKGYTTLNDQSTWLCAVLLVLMKTMLSCTKENDNSISTWARPG